MKRRNNKPVLMLLAVSAVMLAVGCSMRPDKNFDTAQEIGIISREEGSGTRSAFVEIFGIEKINENGDMVDHTALSAVITNNTAVMMTTVSDDRYAIGYISLGSLNDTVKAAAIDGVQASAENIKNGSYKVVREFSIVTKSTVSDAAQDFIDFIFSSDGQSVIELAGYAGVSDNPAYTGGVGSGKITVSGSSSVTAVMEKLKEAYIARNPGVSIDVQQSDSSTGIADTISGICDIGMTSRRLTRTEEAEGVRAAAAALDGIVVIVNRKNPIENLTAEQVRMIFTGEVTAWKDITG